MRTSGIEFLLFFILAILLIVVPATMVAEYQIIKDQRIQICIEHPAYPKCDGEWSDMVVIKHG